LPVKLLNPFEALPEKMMDVRRSIGIDTFKLFVRDGELVDPNAISNKASGGKKKTAWAGYFEGGKNRPDA
jgi:hypothetical protein